MAITSIGTNDALAVKAWAKALAIAEREMLDIAPLMGSDPNSIIHVKSELSKGPGDKVTFGLRTRLSGDGRTEGEIAEGHGEALSLYSDSIYLNELIHVVGVKSDRTIDQQRLHANLREEAKDALAEWWADRKSAWFFNQVCGYTPQTNTKYTGMNAVVAPSSTRRIVAGSGSTDESITSADTFTLNLIDQAKEVAVVGNNMVKPVRIGGGKKYVMYLHPYQVTSMRTNASTGQWLDIQKAAMAGMESTKSPIYSGALGEYNGVILRQSQDVTQGVRSDTGAAVTTVRRAVLLGAQAAVACYGQKLSGINRYLWNEELFDHKRRLEVAATCIGGLKKTVFNSADFGTVVVSSYATASS